MRENFQRRSFAMSDFMKEIRVVSWYKIFHPFADRKEKYLSRNDYEYLILGTFPSIASRDYGYFYGNSTNGFWEYLDEIFNSDLIEKSKEQKEEWLNEKRIALYDIVESYEGAEWYSNDQALFGCGKEHQYSLDFVYEFLQKNKKSKVMVTSIEVKNKFRSKFVCRGVKKSERTEQNLYFEKIESELFYLPSPSGTNRTKTKENKIKEWREAFEKAGLTKQQ